MGKYDRPMPNGKTMDVYDVLRAFDVTCPARQQAIKKILCSGIRGKGSVEQDLIEAKVDIERAIYFAEIDRKAINNLSLDGSVVIHDVHPSLTRDGSGIITEKSNPASFIPGVPPSHPKLKDERFVILIGSDYFFKGTCGPSDPILDIGKGYSDARIYFDNDSAQYVARVLSNRLKEPVTVIHFEDAPFLDKWVILNEKGHVLNQTGDSWTTKLKGAMVFGTNAEASNYQAGLVIEDGECGLSISSYLFAKEEMKQKGRKS